MSFKWFEDLLWWKHFALDILNIKRCRLWTEGMDYGFHSPGWRYVDYKNIFADAFCILPIQASCSVGLNSGAAPPQHRVKNKIKRSVHICKSDNYCQVLLFIFLLDLCPFLLRFIVVFSRCRSSSSVTVGIHIFKSSNECTYRY